MHVYVHKFAFVLHVPVQYYSVQYYTKHHTSQSAQCNFIESTQIYFVWKQHWHETKQEIQGGDIYSTLTSSDTSSLLNAAIYIIG